MTYLLLGIIILFSIGILLRRIFPKMCAICFAVTTTWLVGLIYLMFSSTNIMAINTIMLGILMGGSAVGSMYFVFSNKAENWQIFKLPYIVTLFSLVYVVLSKSIQLNIIILVVSLWVVFLLIYFSRNKQSSKWFKEIVECCKNW